MPLQPKFELRQDDEFVFVRVKVPFVRISEAELSIDGSELQFFCKPYLLKLTFPGRLVDDERTRAVYDIGDGHGTIEIFAPKETRGEDFVDLDLVTRLLQPRMQPPVRSGPPLPVAAAAEDASFERLAALSLADDRSSRPSARERAPRPLIEVIGSIDFDEAEPASRDGSRQASAEGARELAQASAPSSPVSSGVAAVGDTPSSAPLPCSPSAAVTHPPCDTPLPPLLPVVPHYGFNRQFSGLFQGLRAELPGIVDLPEPDTTPPLERRRLREAAEEAGFDADRFQGDLAEGGTDPLYVEAATASPWWVTLSSETPGPAAMSVPSAWAWTEEEAAELAALGNRELLIDGHAVGPLSGGGSSSCRAARPPPLELRPDADGMLLAVERGASEGTAPGRPDAAAASLAAAADDDEVAVPAEGPHASCGPETLRLLLGLPSLLAAYCYDHRMTGGEASCESGWTISVLCPLLAWLDDSTLAEVAAAGDAAEEEGRAVQRSPPPELLRVVPSPLPPPPVGPHAAHPSRPSAAPELGAAAELSAAARAFMRRVLTYPYLRRTDLGTLALMDAAGLLLRGRRPVLRALLAVRRVLAGEEARYMLNRLVLDDYCRWLQCGGGRGGGAPGTASDALLVWLGGALMQAACSLAAELQQRAAGGAPAYVALGLGDPPDGDAEDAGSEEEADTSDSSDEEEDSGSEAAG